MDKSEQDIKREALEMGWIPPERYRGDPEKFIEAEDFVERGRNFIPILKKNNEKMLSQLGQMRGELDQTKQALGEAINALQQFKQFHEENAKNAYARARRELLKQKGEAMKEEDFDKVVAIEDNIHQMDQQMAAAQSKPPTKEKKDEKQPPALDPVMQQWINQNADWYGVNAEKTAYANSIALKVRRENPNLIGLEFLDMVKEEVEIAFGSKRGKKKVEEEEEEEVDDRANGKVASGSRQSSFNGKGKGNKLTYDKLDPEAKKICDRYEQQLVGANKAYKTPEEWRKAYCESIGE